MTTPTENPTAHEEELVRLFTDVTLALEGLGHVVERQGFVLARVDGAEIDLGVGRNVRLLVDHTAIILEGQDAASIAAAISSAVGSSS